MVPGYPWFGPKKFGWGWTPVTWQGWLVTLLFLAIVMALTLAAPFRGRLALVIGLTVGFVGVVALTGTKPGGSWK